MDGGAEDAHFGGHKGDCAARADTLDQQPPAVNAQTGIAVQREDLRAVQSWTAPRPGGLRHNSSPATVNNARDQYT
ncbi:hypothetical protein GCM10022232_89970 [Streptomyces plumbiresistens]|uniref:Uncharacterized protein n=1 Tax=Streptomyces plumbiresistens TaxID=511811 RepID=A0ABP7TR39_9ACTN